MSIRINWPQIVSQLGASYDAPTVFILPSAGRQLLLSVTNRMTWEATFRTENYDFSDWDNLQSLVAQTEYGLMAGIPMDELITALENGFSLIATAIDNQVFPDCPDITLQACNSMSNGDFPDEPPGEIPEFPEPKPETPEPTTPTYEEYKCRAAHKYMDSVRNLIDNLIDLTLEASPYTWMYELLTTEEFGSPVYQVLISIFNFLTNNTYGRIKDDILELFDLLEDDILCAIFTSETPADAFALVDSIIMESDGSYVIRFLLRLFVIDSTTLDPIWVEDAVDVTGYGLAECNCGAPGTTFDYVETFDTNKSGTTIWENTQYVNGWRSDNGGECYSIGHTTDGEYKGWAERGLLSHLGLVHDDVTNWYVTEIRFTIRRNVSQAPESNPYVSINWDDGTSTDLEPVTTDDGYTEYTWYNPTPNKPVWRQVSEIRPGVQINLPGVPGASSWYEYFITSARIIGSYEEAA